MNRLKQPGDSHYDVLGVSAGASDKEIQSAFRRLIDGQGYRVGIPLNRQWLRARQIKEAHATLGDPVKRKAYDEMLGGAPPPERWAMTAEDPATDQLVLPEADREAKVEEISPPEAIGPVEAAHIHIEPEPADEASMPSGEAGGLVEQDGHVDPAAAAVNDNEQIAARKWGAPIAVFLGLLLLLVSSWSGWNRLPPTREGTGVVASNGWRTGGLANQAPGAATSNLDRQGPAPANPPSAPPQPFERQQAGDEGGRQGAGEPAPQGAADDQPAAAGAPALDAPVAGPSSMATKAAAPPANAPAQQPPLANPPSIEPATLETGKADRPIGSPAEWIGGGPSDADNRRGRYQGSVEVQVTVEPGGHVSNCAPVRGSGNAALDELTCRLVVQRARFKPALDAQGRPVASQVYTSFVWGRRPRN
jgi:protein TonB